MGQDGADTSAVVVGAFAGTVALVVAAALVVVAAAAAVAVAAVAEYDAVALLDSEPEKDSYTPESHRSEGDFH